MITLLTSFSVVSSWLEGCVSVQSRRPTRGSFYCVFRYAWPVRQGHCASV